MKYIILSIVTFILFTGCSAKEFNSGVDGAVNDVKEAFNSSKDD